MLQRYLDRYPGLRWILILLSLAAFPVIDAAAAFTENSAWFALAILPPLGAVLWLGPVAGSGLIIFACLFFLLEGLRLSEPGILWNVPILLLMLFPIFLFIRRRERAERLHGEDVSLLEEHLTLTREHYKSDLVINISNQKKFQKYFLLNRISRVFGSQLELDKLAEVIIREVQEIMGPERGRYLLAYNQPKKEAALTRSAPETENTEAILEDQFGLWIFQHRTTLLVSDTHNDFRFQSLGTDSMIRSLMAAPLLSEGRVHGILRAESPWPLLFNTDDLRLFTLLADLAGAAAENARLYKRARELAITDGLTRLYLRRFFNQRLEEEFNRFRESGLPFSLIILDIDHFKRINDRLGHPAGDQILIQLARTLENEARVADILCRFGGEEFAMILPNTNIQGGKIMAERLRAKVGERIFWTRQEKLRITVSVGVGECPAHAIQAKQLIKVADTALYQAKRSGRNRVLAGSEAA